MMSPLLNVVRTGLMAVLSISAFTACSVTVSQNESAIKLINGKVVEDSVPQGKTWYTSAPWDNVDFLVINHNQETVSVTVSDKGQECGANEACIPALQTSDFQTVSGSLTAQYLVDRHLSNANTNDTPSVLYDLYTVRGATDQEDIQNKLILPDFRSCISNTVNKTRSTNLINDGPSVVNTIKICLQSGVREYHITIRQVFGNGFGPSNEARQSMSRYANARQDAQVSEAQLATADVRRKAAEANASITAAAYNTFKRNNVPDALIPELACLNDPNSAARPCIAGTAMGVAAATSVK